MSQFFQSQFFHATSQVCVDDVVAPVFSGIGSLTAENKGQLRATWSAATDNLALQIFYKIYIKAGTATGLFHPDNLVAMTDKLLFDIFTTPDGLFLLAGQQYFVGVRAFDGFQEDSSAVSMSAVSTGGVIDFTPVIQRSIRISTTLNNLTGKQELIVWGERNGARSVATANCVVTVKTSTGATVWTESLTTPNADGVFRFEEDFSPLPNVSYYVVVTMDIDSATVTSQQPFFTVG